MMRPLLLLPLLLAACQGPPPPVPSSEQFRALCEAERNRRGITRLLPPEERLRPECRTAPNAPQP